MQAVEASLVLQVLKRTRLRRQGPMLDEGWQGAGQKPKGGAA